MQRTITILSALALPASLIAVACDIEEPGDEEFRAEEMDENAEIENIEEPGAEPGEAENEGHAGSGELSAAGPPPVYAASTIPLDNCEWQRADAASTYVFQVGCPADTNVVSGGCYNNDSARLDDSMPFEGSMEPGWYVDDGDDWDNLTHNSGWYCRWQSVVGGSTSYAWALCCEDD